MRYKKLTQPPEGVTDLQLMEWAALFGAVAHLLNNGGDDVIDRLVKAYNRRWQANARIENAS